MSKPRQQTIASPAEMQGVGLHTGESVRLRALPAEPGTGIRFRRTDLDGSSEIPARVENVVSTDRGTVLAAGDVRVHTVEHLLSAVAGLEIDNLIIELDGPEAPATDGSASPFVEKLFAAGPEAQDAPATVIEVREAFSVAEGSARFAVAPASEYRISTTIDFDHPLIGRQFCSFRVDPETFPRELAAARTFGFLREVDGLRERGLARGGTPQNVLVLTETGLLDGCELRFADEFVRHKTLDIIGDLALVGARLCAHVVAERPGHRANVELARELLARSERQAQPRPILDIQQILQYLPHRYPFLLVDRVVEYEEKKRIVGIKNVTINEPFFVGHFPGHPIMPGVLIIEAMAQVGGLLVMDSIENPKDKIVYFMALNDVKWRRPVTPGDQIRFEVEVLQIRGHTSRMRGVGFVDGQVVAEAEMMARAVDR
ncbi:MAG TPA: bifunctional UDP-3-O-[3-hydroxymyristoyl] N-acetylglucosamine deacetylase/3-hydroxyacyl-ACP dehydratase [Longimicrobiaceae bacterium]|nr:bifunctional UDP-3-O-[3-hydroxymyristoyl] N-acetylglucosamine deacetylase/3-hydroxyacyl-ACP dehydratase [Longimicrobiaceae bacterium]